MLNNYQYFLALARSASISAAAEQLNVSHQGLSLYLKNLERELGTKLFERSPRLTLTDAGRAVRDGFCEVEFIERNVLGRLDDIAKNERGEFRFGLPEGRFRILMPGLLPAFKSRWPHVKVRTVCAPSRALRDLLLKNDLDAALLDQTAAEPAAMDLEPMLDEQLFLTISDALLESVFDAPAEALRERFRTGVSLAGFAAVPFILNERGSTSRTAVDAFAATRGIALSCAMELPQLDLHAMLSARGYAASFCWSMYLSVVADLNRRGDGPLNAFPVKGLDAHNCLMFAVRKKRTLPAYGREFKKLLREACAPYSRPDLNRL